MRLTLLYLPAHLPPTSSQFLLEDSSLCSVWKNFLFISRVTMTLSCSVDLFVFMHPSASLQTYTQTSNLPSASTLCQGFFPFKSNQLEHQTPTFECQSKALLSFPFPVTPLLGQVFQKKKRKKENLEFINRFHFQDPSFLMHFS